uniref:Amino acid adenylation domain-containing protein n=1 Tax=Streptomyces sp. NRRL 30471 TaxID=996287 RepID=F2WUD7_9ACTN|nr:amino acid adenylation domain-containing protein [Streptomyces sp. NRRL 30471]
MAHVPTSLQQESRLTLLPRYGPASPTAACWLLRGVHQEALVEALGVLVRRHDALRMSFPGTDPTHAWVTPPDARISLTERRVADKTEDEEIRTFLRDQLGKPFAPGEAPLHRFVLVRQGLDKLFFGMAVDHMVWDGLSLRRFVEDLRRVYSRGPAALSSRPPKYADFSNAQRRELEGVWGRERRAFWEGKFDRWGGYPPACGLTDAELAADPGRSDASATAERELGSDNWSRIRAYAATNRATVFAVVAAQLLTAQAELSGHSRTGLVTETHGRVLPRTAGALGLFSHGVPVLLDVDAAPPSGRLVQVGDAIMDAVEMGLPLRPFCARWRAERAVPDVATPFLYFGMEDAGQFAGLWLPRVSVAPFSLYPDEATRPGRSSDMLAVHLIVNQGTKSPAPFLHAQFDRAVFPEIKVRALLDRTIDLLNLAEQ